jgi:hypothetical protein
MRTLKKNTKRSRKYRKKQILFRRGGNDDKKSNYQELTNEEKVEMNGFEKVIQAFLAKEKKTSTLKYAMNKTKIDKYNNNDMNEREKYELMRDLTHLIIKDDAHDLFFDAEVASFQVLIDNMYKYLTSFVGVEHDIQVDYYLKSLVNSKPFVKVYHSVNGYNTVHDVDNLLAYIKHEYINEKNDKPYSEKTFIFHGKKIEDKKS